MSDDMSVSKLPLCPDTPAAQVLYARGKCRLKGQKAKRPATQNKSKLPPCSGLPRVLVPKMIAAGKCRESTGSLKPKKTPHKPQREVSCVRACSNKPKTFSLSSVFTSVLKIVKDSFRPMINVFKEIFLEVLGQGGKRTSVVLEAAALYFPISRVDTMIYIKIREDSKVQLGSIIAGSHSEVLVYDLKTGDILITRYVKEKKYSKVFYSKDKQVFLDVTDMLLLVLCRGHKVFGYWRDPGGLKALSDTPDFGSERAEKILLKLKEIIEKERPFVVVSGPDNYI